jgi:hypothetical protein
MKIKPLGYCLSFVITAFLFSCNFPYQPQQFVLPENPFKFPSSQTVKAFADNAKNVKLAYTLMEGSRWVYYVDFSDTAPRPIKLKKPAGKETMHADSPLISPDGSFVAYFMTQGGSLINGAYIQKLDPSSEPVLIAANGTEPHWWVDSQGVIYIIYSDNMHVGGTLTLNQGNTYKLKVDISGDGKAKDGPFEIAPYPMNGGLSKNGQFLCTGYERAAFYDLVNKQLTPINPDKQVCNPSIDPDSSHPDWMMFLNFSGTQNLINPYKTSPPAVDTLGTLPIHAVLFVVDATNTVRDFVPITIMGDGYESWQDPEWSNDPHFAAALAMINESKSNFVIINNIGDRDKKKEGLIVTIGAGKLNETSTPYVWIDR